MTLILQLLAKAWPYLIVGAISAGSGWEAKSVLDAKVLATTEEGYEKKLADVSATAARNATAALATQQEQQTTIANLDAKYLQEKQAHEADGHKYVSALAAGTQRLRVAVRNCTASTATTAPGAAGLDDGASATADVDPAVASRVFGVADVDQQQADKLVALQAYVCTIRPDLQACQRQHAAPSSTGN